VRGEGGSVTVVRPAERALRRPGGEGTAMEEQDEGKPPASCDGAGG